MFESTNFACESLKNMNQKIPCAINKFHGFSRFSMDAIKFHGFSMLVDTLLWLFIIIQNTDFRRYE